MLMEEAAALAQSVYASGRERGFSGEYRYRRASCDGEILLLFLNCERELSTFRGFLYASVGVSLAGTLAVFLLLLPLSGRIVRPIAERYAKQKRFITDAGHELKTPITIIRADAEVLQSELDGENEWLADIRKQTQRLAELTADLIYLSRMEEENAALQMQPLSLSELVDETAQSFQALARSKGKRFSASVAPGLGVNGDEKALAKLVSILLDVRFNRLVDREKQRRRRNILILSLILWDIKYIPLVFFAAAVSNAMEMADRFRKKKPGSKRKTGAALLFLLLSLICLALTAAGIFLLWR